MFSATFSCSKRWISIIHLHRHECHTIYGVWCSMCVLCVHCTLALNQPKWQNGKWHIVSATHETRQTRDATQLFEFMTSIRGSGWCHAPPIWAFICDDSQSLPTPTLTPMNDNNNDVVWSGSRRAEKLNYHRRVTSRKHHARNFLSSRKTISIRSARGWRIVHRNFRCAPTAKLYILSKSRLE